MQETHISTENLLAIIGEKQVLLDIANNRIAAMERAAREHMASEHPPLEMSDSMQDTADRIEDSLDTSAVPREE
jgi:hypothetical protein